MNHYKKKYYYLHHFLICLENRELPFFMQTYFPIEIKCLSFAHLVVGVLLIRYITSNDRKYVAQFR